MRSSQGGSFWRRRAVGECSASRVGLFQERAELLIWWFDLGFDFATAGTVVNGGDDFAFCSVSILDRFFRMLVHRCAAIRTTHCFLIERNVLPPVAKNFCHPDKFVKELIRAP